MKVNISLVIFGAVAVSAIALPAEAAAVFGTDKKTPTDTFGPPAAAYRVDGVIYNGLSYNVYFDHGSFNDLYGVGASRFDPAFANGIGTEILAALANTTEISVEGRSRNIPSRITQLIDGWDNALAVFGPNFGPDLKSQFYIPITPATGSVDNTAFCTVLQTCNTTPQNENGPVLYARWGEPTPVNPGDPSVPTPALIPGLLGMGLAALRKKQQST
jgi:hypothetical protein